MQIFHKSFIKSDLHLHGNMRQQAAGIISNYEFDSIILGTSMLENTSAFEATKIVGGNFVNISLSGSSFFEREPILSYALKKKNLKNIIYSLDSTYIDLNKSHKSYPINTYSFLYDENYFNDFKAYLNKNFFKCFFDIFNKT